MTNRERILTAVKRGTPDCVPCAPWMAILFPAKVLNIKLGDLCGALASYPIWKATLETSKKFNVVSDILSPLCIGGGEYVPVRDAPVTENTKVSKRIIKEDGDNRYVEITVTTPEGDCVEERVCPVEGVDAGLKPLIEDPDRDYPKIQYLLTDPETFDWEDHLAVQKEVGESGIVRLGFDTPWTRWIIYRGTEGYTDFYDYPAVLDRFFEDYLDHVLKYIMESEKHNPDVFWVHGVYDALVGPNIQNKYIYPFIKKVRESTDVPLVRFVSGKISHLLEIEAETGVDVIEVLEPTPTGNVDLSDAKKRIGEYVCIKGNMDPINMLEKSSIRELEEQVKWSIEVAAAGGGYIFATADEVTQLTPEENIYALVEYVNKYGKY
jgi:hypothetical protein